MANPPCMSNDGNAAVFVGTFLENGDSVALCDACMVPWAAAVLEVTTGIDPAPFIRAISEGPEQPEPIEGDTPEAEHPAGEVPDKSPSGNGKRSRARATPPTPPEPVTTTGEEGEPAPVESPPTA